MQHCSTFCNISQFSSKLFWLKVFLFLNFYWRIGNTRTHTALGQLFYRVNSWPGYKHYFHLQLHIFIVHVKKSKRVRTTGSSLSYPTGAHTKKYAALFNLLHIYIFQFSSKLFRLKVFLFLNFYWRIGNTHTHTALHLQSQGLTHVKAESGHSWMM